MHYETVWEFRTARFRVALEIGPEDMDPADSFQFDEDIEAVRSGVVEWFCARVSVYLDDRRIASDHLGGCAYNSIDDFYTLHRKYKSGDYFTDMVSTAITQAREFCVGVPVVHRREQ